MAGAQDAGEMMVAAAGTATAVEIAPELLRDAVDVVDREEARAGRMASLVVLEGLLSAGSAILLFKGAVGEDLGPWRYALAGVAAAWTGACLYDWFGRDEKKEKLTRLAMSLRDIWNAKNAGTGPGAAAVAQAGTGLREARAAMPPASFNIWDKDNITWYALFGTSAGFAAYGLMEGGMVANLVGVCAVGAAIGTAWMGIQNDIDIREDRQALDSVIRRWDVVGGYNAPGY